MRFPFDFSKLSILGFLEIFGGGVPQIFGVSNPNFFGVKNAKKNGIFGGTQEIWDFWDFFGVEHGLSNILIFSMCDRAGSGYFFSPS